MASYPYDVGLLNVTPHVTEQQTNQVLTPVQRQEPDSLTKKKKPFYTTNKGIIIIAIAVVVIIIVAVVGGVVGSKNARARSEDNRDNSQGDASLPTPSSSQA
jgi:uncharacterized membrane protein